MTGNLEQLPERVGVLERKLDSLSASVDRRFDEVDKRFDEVTQHFVEQRQYTEFAFETLERRMVAGFERLEGRMVAGFRTHSDRLERIERKLDQFIDRVHSVSHTPRTRKKR
ncbi:MAG TPA: hypothetical protein VI485_27230 [Vicinamibacterales bacterium]|nr:hypothetical protein [Vicinamibacterales bacterium]